MHLPPNTTEDDFLAKFMPNLYSIWKKGVKLNISLRWIPEEVAKIVHCAENYPDQTLRAAKIATQFSSLFIRRTLSSQPPKKREWPKSYRNSLKSSQCLVAAVLHQGSDIGTGYFHKVSNERISKAVTCPSVRLSCSLVN